MSAKKMQAYFWQQLDEQRMEDKKKRQRREERSKKLEKSNNIIEYAKVVKFGDWNSIPKVEEKSREPGKVPAMISGYFVTSLFSLACEIEIKSMEDLIRLIKPRSILWVPLQQIKRRNL